LQKPSVRILDLKIDCNHQEINLSKLQGYEPRWIQDPKIPELPNPLRECQNTADNQALSKMRYEFTFYSQLNLLINQSFIPDSSAFAHKAIQYLKENGSDLV
jgi:hypothetical protein